MSAAVPREECKIIHYSEVTQKELNQCSKVILSGNTLKDQTVPTHPKAFSWLRDCDKPVLGICAGMQAICLAFDVPVVRCLKMGITEFTTTQDNPLFCGLFKAYCLHNFTVEDNEKFLVLAKSARCIQAIKHKQKPIFGVLFHPEVRNREIIEKFTQL
jgi:GMP synthase (glutamine-hydrolysing)